MIREVVLEMKLLEESEFDRLVSPEQVMRLGSSEDSRRKQVRDVKRRSASCLSSLPEGVALGPERKMRPQEEPKIRHYRMERRYVPLCLCQGLPLGAVGPPLRKGQPSYGRTQLQGMGER